MLVIYEYIFLGLVITIQAQMEGFIVGGDLASINRYPHSAFLTIACVTEGNARKVTWICGSSIINQRIVLTAGHCVYHCITGTHIIVNMGHENRVSGVKRSASSYIIHEKYSPKTSSHDIALIKMAKSVTFNSKISRVAIMKKPPYNEPAYLAGWGLVNENTKQQSVILKAVDQKVWRHGACQEMLGGLPRGTICASSKIRQDFAAQGDSGSGLMVRGYIQLGLVSHKLPFIANNVVIYTDIGFYYDWIAYNAHRLYCSTYIN